MAFPRGYQHEPSTDFPYDEVDAHDGPETTEERILDALDRIDDAALMELPAVRRLLSRHVGKVLRIMRSDTRSRLAADCMMLAIGGELNEDGTSYSGTQVADEHGMTKSAIWKRVAQYEERLGLPRNRNQKSPDARRRYSLTNKCPIRLGD